MQQTNILHLEQFKILRQVVRTILATEPNINLIDHDIDEVNLVKVIEEQRVDILILGINTQINSGGQYFDDELCRQVSENFPLLKILVHSPFEDQAHISLMIESGALAFVSKQSGYEEFREVVRELSLGRRSGNLKNCETPFDNLSRNFIPSSRPRRKHGIFSTREIEVLKLLSKGLSTYEIGEALYIGSKTVETHRKNLMQKIKAKNTSELISYSFRQGILLY